jgi:hypothetical protein
MLPRMMVLLIVGVEGVVRTELPCCRTGAAAIPDLEL